MSEIKIIGNKIAEARKKINISQSQLAQHLFVSSQAVGKWERGESMPDITTFSRLAEILGVDLNYFSESFSSSAAAEPVIKQPEEKQEKKLNWDMSLGNWVDADFSGLKNLHEKFSSSNMQRCKFIGSDMSGLHLKGNNVASCDFSGSDFSNSHFQRSHLSGNIFKDCILKDAEFSESHATGCDFSGADFTGTVFKSGGMEKSAVVNAVWSHTSFKDAYLADLIFDGKLDDCYFENCSFSKITFQNATLTNTFFKCRSLKHLRFIDCQADRMTYEFLKNGKANLSGITLLTA